MKLKNLLLGAVATAFMTSCGSGVDMKDPKAVTEGFHAAFAAQDWDGAKALATAKSAEAIDAVASMAGMGEKEDPKKVEKVACDEPADHKCNCSVDMEGEESTSYALIQDGEEWKVEYSKGLGDSMESMGDAMGDAMEGVMDEAMDAVEDVVETGLYEAMEVVIENAEDLGKEIEEVIEAEASAPNLDDKAIH